jgi:hypothetical protein
MFKIINPIFLLEKKTFSLVFFSFLMGLLFLVILSSCGKSKKGSPPPPTPPPVVTPQNTQMGFYSQTGNIQIPGYINNGSQLSMGPGMRALLKEAMGVCDREHISAGIASCDTWLRGGFDLVLLSPQGSRSQTVKLIMRSIPASQLGGFGWYTASLPNFRQFIGCLIGFCSSNPAGMFNPLVLEANIFPVNNSQGFEVRAYGPYGSRSWNKLFQFQVHQGKLEDGRWNFIMYFDGAVAAQGLAVRCQSENCGLDTSIVRGY